MPKETNKEVLCEVKGIPFYATKIQRSNDEDKKDLVYPAPSVEWAMESDENYEKLEEYFTKKRTAKTIIGKIKAACQAAMLEVKGDIDAFVALAESIGARSETIADLESEIADLMESNQSLLTSSVELMGKALQATNNDERIALFSQVTELNQKIKANNDEKAALEVRIESKRRTNNTPAEVAK